jgi:Protein of unknown function (DUF1573)
MRSIFYLMALVLAGASATAQPKIRMQTVHDWGRLDPKYSNGHGFELKASIPVANIGTDTLHIIEVRPACGCTTAPIKDSVLAPGEETSIEVTMLAPTTNGPISKHITVITNELVDYAHLLEIKADIQRPVQLSGAYIGFNRGIAGTEILGEFSITNRSPDTLIVSDGTVEYEGRFVTSMPIAIPPEGSRTLTIGLMWPHVGPFSAKVGFKTTHPDHPLIEIMAYGIAEAAQQKP